MITNKAILLAMAGSAAALVALPLLAQQRPGCPL